MRPELKKRDYTKGGKAIDTRMARDKREILDQRYLEKKRKLIEALVERTKTEQRVE